MNKMDKNHGVRISITLQGHGLAPVKASRLLKPGDMATSNNAPRSMSDLQEHVGVDRDSTATEAILGGAAGAAEGTWPNPGGDAYQNGEIEHQLPAGAEAPPWDIGGEDLHNLIATMGGAENVAVIAGMPAHLHEAVAYHLMQALTTFHRVQRRDWPVSPWHRPFLPPEGSFMNTLDLDPEMLLRVARPYNQDGPPRYGVHSSSYLDRLSDEPGAQIMDIWCPPLETWPAQDRRLFFGLMQVGNGARDGMTWGLLARVTEMREQQEERARRAAEEAAREAFLKWQWRDATVHFDRWASGMSGATLREVTLAVHGPVGQACWMLFEICPYGRGGVAHCHAAAGWVRKRLYGERSARVLTGGMNGQRDIEDSDVIQLARRPDMLEHFEWHMIGPRGRQAGVEDWYAIECLLRAWYFCYWNSRHTVSMRREVEWLWNPHRAWPADWERGRRRVKRRRSD